MTRKNCPRLPSCLLYLFSCVTRTRHWLNCGYHQVQPHLQFYVVFDAFLTLSSLMNSHHSRNYHLIMSLRKTMNYLTRKKMHCLRYLTCTSLLSATWSIDLNPGPQSWSWTTHATAWSLSSMKRAACHWAWTACPSYWLWTFLGRGTSLACCRCSFRWLPCTCRNTCCAKRGCSTFGLGTC